MDCKNTQTRPSPTRSLGFTLVELLVVIAIIAVLALVAFSASGKMIAKGQAVQARAQFRDVGAGIQGFMGDYQKPPLPTAERASGTDVVYGVPSTQYGNDFVMAALMPSDEHTKIKYEEIKDVNPRGETYLNVPYVPGNKNGLGTDGILYDPWGQQIMIAVNAPPFASETPAGGVHDRVLYTAGYADYSDLKPNEQDYVMWTYGKDKKKGKEGSANTALVPIKGTDDAASFQ